MRDPRFRQFRDISGLLMRIFSYERARVRVLAGWRNRAVSFKAVAFALVGVVNTAVDYGV